jgi:DNA/RNA-binding domain of Phe-tRNA-synthetase-like protein
MEIQIQLPYAKLGIIEAATLRVTTSDERLARLMDEICEGVHRQFTLESLADAEPISAVRAMFRAWGVDPSKYRPSSEALMRRVVQGKGLYRVSTVVDIGNLGSVQTGWPFGLYDRSKLRPSIVFRNGARDETYEGIGKRTWHLGGRPVLADADGPFGSPISDSTRSMVTESATSLLGVIYAPQSAPIEALTRALDVLAGRLKQFASAAEVRTAIFG